MKFNVTRHELEITDYGRGAARIIAGARFAVVAQGAGGMVEHVLSTHRTESAAVKTLTRAARHSGRLHIGQIQD